MSDIDYFRAVRDFLIQPVLVGVYRDCDGCGKPGVDPGQTLCERCRARVQQARFDNATKDAAAALLAFREVQKIPTHYWERPLPHWEPHR
jgi:hypothetical protein